MLYRFFTLSDVQSDEVEPNEETDDDDNKGNTLKAPSDISLAPTSTSDSPLHLKLR